MTTRTNRPLLIVLATHGTETGAMTSFRAALVLAALTTAGCYRPNGKHGVLYFGLELANGAGNGLAQDVSVPQSVQFDLGGRNSLDFAGASISGQGPGLVVEGTGVIDSRQQQQEQGGFWLRVQCDPSNTQVTRELTVDIQAGGQTRYRDSIDLTCHTSTALTFTTISPPRWIIGASVPTSPTLEARDNLLSTTQPIVGGHGWAVGDAQPSVAIADDDYVGSGTLLLTTVGAGSNPTIVAGTVNATVPVEVVDDTTWTLSLTVTRSTPYSDGNDAGSPAVDLTCSGGSVGKDGVLVGGLGGESSLACEFTVTVGGAPLAAQAGDGCYTTLQVPADASGQVCATGARHTTCVAFGP